MSDQFARTIKGVEILREVVERAVLVTRATFVYVCPNCDCMHHVPPETKIHHIRSFCCGHCGFRHPFPNYKPRPRRPKENS